MVIDKNRPSLEMLSRSLREILEKKAKIERKIQTREEEVEDIDMLDVEKEIQVKLLYLGKIHRLKEGRRIISQCDKVEKVASLLINVYGGSV